MLYSLSEPTKSVVGVKTSPRDEEREKEGEKMRGNAKENELLILFIAMC